MQKSKQLMDASMQINSKEPFSYGEEGYLLYKERTKQYSEILNLKKTSEYPLSFSARKMKYFNGFLYIGLPNGEVFLYKEEQEKFCYQERFQVTESPPVIIEERGYIIVGHSDGTVFSLRDKTCTTAKIPKIKASSLHPHTPLLISQAEGNLHFTDMQEIKEYVSPLKTQDIPLSVHKNGSSLLLRGKSVSLMDIRTMQKELELPEYKSISSGIFLSSGVDMVVTNRRHIHTVDLRTMESVKRIRTKNIANTLYEFNSCLFYSGDNLYARGVCSVTGSSLFPTTSPGAIFASNSSQLYIADANNTLSIYTHTPESIHMPM
ncbi:hypothetical protein NEFER03_1205 [Nematocida sp. LUAm3]|nr:hypothetical protein NEFER03_1205 [Nematocida sp. LUAm3]KAI5175814.1 hypothetical protein NEFER02_1683 [Nematocida sp. LUAm2]KAI5178310.1 hypothetical protein NEFER01_1477 [Nematocida sp. LUAm1]